MLFCGVFRWRHSSAALFTWLTFEFLPLRWVKGCVVKCSSLIELVPWLFCPRDCETPVRFSCHHLTLPIVLEGNTELSLSIALFVIRDPSNLFPKFSEIKVEHVIYIKSRTRYKRGHYIIYYIYICLQMIIQFKLELNLKVQSLDKKCNSDISLVFMNISDLT